MYELSDAAIKRLNHTIQKSFSEMRQTILAFDEIWAVQTAVNEAYGNIERSVRKIYLDVANEAYKGITGRDTMFTALWLEQFLRGYDPVTRYVFAHEFDRKRARTFETIVSTLLAKKKNQLPKEIKKAMKELATQTTQYADEVMDAAMLQGYKDSGITRVRWVSEQDGRVCEECRKRNGRTYAIDKVPVKPHIRCRCYLLPSNSPTTAVVTE